MVDRHGRRGRSHSRPRGREEGAETRGATTVEQRPRAIPAELARIAGAALDAALAAIPGAAFVVRAPGAVVHANPRGAALLVADREPVAAALRTGAASGPRGARRFPVDAEHVLVVLPDMSGDARTRVPAVARRWGLTPRQAAVLAVVAEGATNRTVAERLVCSEKTVELHVSALLAKAGCGGRAELVARFWTEHG
jgi:DNA-binding CsgD family transcriptional regulator